ncbi:MAG: PaaI family thioesterase [Eubacterium sp.]|jgi:acyl-CoA thioesterase|uniref:PaaI family thioesterase n=1 Tax=Eubacterium sp. F2 TaxID=3381348 RepID=UPI003908039F|nr:PaaI family thioesterase [Eubacterium sp.]MCI2197082.1 PaaI family thioesterase [Eubacterium sp.]
MTYQEIMDLRNKTNAFAIKQGIKVTELSKGYAKAWVKITPELQNPTHSVHGGLLFTLCDIACGSAASSYGIQITTVDSSMHFLRAAINVPELFAEAREIKHGRRVMVFEADVKDREGTLYCRGIFTIMKLKTPLQGGRTKEPAE